MGHNLLSFPNSHPFESHSTGVDQPFTIQQLEHHDKWL
jgi:hypothetical protein